MTGDQLRQVLAEALQMAFGLEAKVTSGGARGTAPPFIYAYVYVREETQETEAIVAGLLFNLRDKRLEADICGEESGKVYYEAESVILENTATADDLSKVAVKLASCLTENQGIND